MISNGSQAVDRNGMSDPDKDLVRKRKRGSTAAHASPSRWRTINKHRIYSSKLLEALRRVRRVRRTESPSKPPGRDVREAADQALAVTARGGTRWSSAILSGRPARLQSRRVLPGGGERRKKPAGSAGNGRKMAAVDRKVKFLSRLVPGCRKLPLLSMLDEASDYIAALEMQVRAMTTLAELLAAGSPATGPAELASASGLPN